MSDQGAANTQQTQQPVGDEAAGMGLIGHLTELRGRIVKALLSIIPGFIIAYNFAPSIIDFLIRPLKNALPAGQNLIATGLPDTFIIHLKTGLWGGVFLSSPFWLYQFWSFAAPGLYRRERRQVVALSLGAASLMVGGAAFAYFVVFPLAFRFFVSYSNETISLLPAINQYLSLVMTMLVAFGAVFQLPLLLMFLAHIGVVNAGFLRKFRRYAILIIVIVAAVLTPPDVISQCLMSIPMLALYELSIILIGHMAKKRSADDAAPVGDHLEASVDKATKPDAASPPTADA